MGISLNRGILVALLATVMLAGCASNKPQEPAASPEPAAQPEQAAPAPAPEPAQPAQPAVVKRSVSDGKLVVPNADGGTEELAGTFYFDFDQAIVKPEGFDELNKHAEALKGDTSLKVRLEGNTDERGTREYNLALGERRANAVKAYLVAQGVSPSQIEVVSYGEEKPVDPGHNEAAWAKNRRVQIVYE